MEANTLRERVKKFLDFSKISYADFGARAGKTSSYVTNISKNITGEVIAELKAINKNLSLDWLLLGQGEMFAVMSSDLQQAADAHAAQLAETTAKYEKQIKDLRESNKDLREKLALYQEIVKLKAELETSKNKTN